MMQLPLSQKSRDLVGLLRVHHQNPVSLSSFRLDADRSNISMMNLYFFFWALLLVDGVSGVEKVNVTVSVMEGDSVTLKPQTVIPEGETTQWFFDGTRIAKINKTDSTDERFRGRLKLDHQTGSLTITNIKKTDSGLYELQIERTNDVTSKTFDVTVSDVVESVSVTEGDTVTLHTGVTDIQRGDVIKLFGDQGVLIADLNGPDDTRWRNIHRNNENGEITIRNIRTDQSGDYKLEINTASMILHRKLYINISAVTGEMKTVSVKEGEFVTLDTRLIGAKGYDLIMWKFEDQIIAELNKGTDEFSTHDTRAGGRFNGRLKPGQTTVSLIISDSRITDTGDYSVHMNSSSHTVQRIISVTVSDSGVSPGAVTGIAVAVLLVFAAVLAAGVIYHRRKISELQRLRNDAENNGTGVPLNKVTG